MSKSVKVAGIAVAATLAYTAASWMIGMKVETMLGERYSELTVNPALTLTRRDYTRGVFSATETATFEIRDIWIEPLRVTAVTHIQHGPFPGFSDIAAARSETSLVFSEFPQEIRQPLLTLLGGDGTVVAHTLIHFNGSGRASWRVPSGRMEGLLFKGFEAAIDFTRDFDSYLFTGHSAGAEFQGDRGSLRIAEVEMSGDGKRLFADGSSLYVGKQHFVVADFSLQGHEDGDAPLTLERIAFDVDTPVRGDFLDILLSLDIARARIGENEYAPVAYHLSLRNLHARALARFYAVLGTAADDFQPGSEDFAEALSAAIELLIHQPVLKLDRLSLTSPEGEAMLSGYLKFDDVQREDANDPVILANKLEAGANISVSQALLERLAGQRAASPEEAQLRRQQFAATLNDYIARGFITRADGHLGSQLLFREGTLLLNGKEYEPLLFEEQEDHGWDDEGE